MTQQLQRPDSATLAEVAQVQHIVLPAFNEGASLPTLLSRLAALKAPLVVWVVNDGSSDDTAMVALRGYDDLDVRLITHERNLGLGQAVHTGLRSALELAEDDDAIIVMDADDTHDVHVIDALVNELRLGADIAIASRFVEGGDDSTAPAFRRFLSRGAAVMFRTLLPCPDGIQDFTCGYRGYRASVVRRTIDHYGERLIEEDGFAVMVELLLKLRHTNPVITEVPLVLRYDRKEGMSKMRLGRTLRQYFKLALRDRLSPPPYRTL